HVLGKIGKAFAGARDFEARFLYLQAALGVDVIRLGNRLDELPEPDEIEAPRLERVRALGGLRQERSPGDLVLDFLDELLDARRRGRRLLLREREERMPRRELREVDAERAAPERRARDERDDEREILAVDAAARGHAVSRPSPCRSTIALSTERRPAARPTGGHRRGSQLLASCCRKRASSGRVPCTPLVTEA